MAMGRFNRENRRGNYVSIYPDTDNALCCLTSLFPGINSLIEVYAIAEIGKSLK
jgi:hypothetical protein